MRKPSKVQFVKRLWSSAMRLLNANIAKRRAHASKTARRLALDQVPGAGVPDAESVRHPSAVGGRWLRRRQMAMARTGGRIIVIGAKGATFYKWQAC